MKSKRYVQMVLLLLLMLLLITSVIVIIVDPYFHYHAPLPRVSYRLFDQRQQNYGIGKHFEYNAIITGTSMTENFRTTEFDELFDKKSIKIPFSGAMFKEVNNAVINCFEYNNDIEMVIRSIDEHHIVVDKDAMKYDSYPDYLYDSNFANDVNYLLNKNTLKDLMNVIITTRSGIQTTSFDNYSAWRNEVYFGKEVVAERADIEFNAGQSKQILTDEEKDIIYGNIDQNLISIARDNPNTEFYYFFPPYSILYYSNAINTNSIDKVFEISEYVTELMLEYDNIKIFSFIDLFDITSNLELYRDDTHYHYSVNSYILEAMSVDNHLITQSNYQEHLSDSKKFYEEYDYESMLNYFSLNKNKNSN